MIDSIKPIKERLERPLHEVTALDIKLPEPSLTNCTKSKDDCSKKKSCNCKCASSQSNQRMTNGLNIHINLLL
ncbi:unnamed protein product [Dracunculus medinensis]|uniref:Uncharacterized protein n=1 Tax=Dracunculus medinensis TaxID=318479 RepID=A0A0N4UQI6_DRAME|nr:unnamed protein product [Dracunculus medinensis]